jgi:hypothetical protein
LSVGRYGMRFSCDETLLVVGVRSWSRTSRPLNSGRRVIPCGELPNAARGRWISCSTETKFAGWSRTRTRVPMGTVGAIWQGGDAIPKRGALRGECRGWEGDPIRQVRHDAQEPPRSQRHQATWAHTYPRPSAPPSSYSLSGFPNYDFNSTIITSMG